jgi:hypothetical protein
MRAASSDMDGSAMGAAEGVGDVERLVGKEGEGCLDRDTRLSRASWSKMAVPRLHSS